MTRGAEGPPRGAGPPGGEASGARIGGQYSSSPCTSVCRIDEATGLCVGCLRTLDEIAAWSTLGDDARRAIVAALPDRRATHSRDPGGGAR
ncbi:MAG: DUF1289 domain-containing protein [Burkholderiales bacterium]|nr:DUF1289 domain-containing protein [Burkholderiales bacterium]